MNKKWDVFWNGYRTAVREGRMVDAVYLLNFAHERDSEEV